MTDAQNLQESFELRITLADNYLNEHLEGQEAWYNNKATRYKLWSKWLGLLIIAAGAATTMLQIWTPEPVESAVSWTAIATAALGVMIILAKGIERLWSFDENWLNYRQASEAIKREKRYYINGAGPYRDEADETAAYRLFVERVEDVIMAEQHTFWQNSGQAKGQDQ
ncbi:MAG: DUF4231 domain-containing protein [Gammaproteobacteria bacterium]|nr:DUF4231 domain-containing protein [Gammaproteobacteria bacterium]